MIGLGLNCCCGNCDWCSDYDTFGAIKAVFELHGWTSLAGDTFGLCTGYDTLTIATTETVTVDVAASLPPCDLDEEVTVTPYCYYRRRGAYPSHDAVIEVRFYVYQAGADLRGAVFVTLDETSPVAIVTAKADFLIAASATTTECATFSLTDEPLTICSTTGTLAICGMPTTFDLEMAVV